MIRRFDPARDLQISRFIRAPRSAVWRAWTDPRSFEEWWVPAPAKCKVQEMELRPGGALVTRISEHGGDFVPHLDACFLEVEDSRRLVFTNALVHRSGSDRDMHEKMGFFDGWGTVIAQLAQQVERAT